MHDLIPLDHLLPGQVTVVGQIIGRGDQTRHLAELGLHAGAEIELIQPGRPCIVRVLGQRLCLRTDDLTGVLVYRPAVVAAGA